jgi:cobalt-zinc-cadmium resistance protein CzcA
MIDQFVALCFRKRLVVRLIAIFAAIFGVYAWTQLAIDAYPLISPVSVQVTTQVPGLAAQESEQQITIPLERSLYGTPGLVSMRSVSTFGLSQINMLFRDGAEDYFVRQRVRERIGDVTLPGDASPGLDNVTSPELEIYRYTVESDVKNLIELSEYQRWVIQPALRQVPGVAGVDNFGGLTRQFRVDLNPTELLRYGIGLNDVTNAINNNTSNAGGGRVARGDQSFIIRGVGLVHTLEDLGNIMVSQTNGVPVFIRDLGALSYAHQEPEGILGFNENPATMEGIVTGLKYSNVSEIINGIHAKVEELRKHRNRPGSGRSRFRNRQQGGTYADRRHRPRHRCPDAVSGESTDRIGRGGDDTVGHGLSIRADELRSYVRQHAVARRARFRRHCRRRDCGDGKYSSAPRIKT